MWINKQLINWTSIKNWCVFAARCGCISAAYAVMRCAVSVCVCVCVSVCLSVCLSRSWVVSKRIKISSKFFSPSGRHTILVFPYQMGWRYSNGNPSNGGVECRWSRQKSRFWAYNLAGLPVLTLQQTGVVNAFTGGARPACRKLWHIAGSKRRCWLLESTTKMFMTRSLNVTPKTTEKRI